MIPLQVVGLVQDAAGVDGIAAKGQVAALPLDQIGEGTGSVPRSGDAAEASRAQQNFAVTP